ncbi:hypothetical protein [Actinoplanes sp. NPDC049265]|uniref:hypothetical protein n=1 Tax=Actinoplanes sp. NPDC049265 TaxID=3363902 RepID=UPI003724AD37
MYDFSTFNFPVAAETPVDRTAFDTFPPEYAALAYLLEASGFPVANVFPTRGSEPERKLKAEAALWLTTGKLPIDEGITS